MRARRNRRTRLASSLIRVGVLALVTGGGWWFWKQRNRPPADRAPTPVDAPIVPSAADAATVPVTVPTETEPQPSGGDASPGPGEPAQSTESAEPATIKGNATSMLYHTPASPSYKRMKAEILFHTEEEARAAGYRRWDHKRTSGGTGS